MRYLFTIFIVFCLTWPTLVIGATPELKDNEHATDARNINAADDAETKQEPLTGEAWVKLGHWHMDAKRFAEAIIAYHKALAINPNDADVLTDLGTCMKEIGEPKQAIEQYRMAIKINPNHPMAHRNMGIVLATDLKDNKNAIKELEKYLNLDPNAADAESVRRYIKDLTLPSTSVGSDCKDNSSTSNTPLCAAQVKNGVAAFSFRITDNGPWTWHRNNTEDRALEYSWEIEIGSLTSAYNFGYYLFKFSGQQQHTGSLDELLQDAQLSVSVSKPGPDDGTEGSFRDDLRVRGGIFRQWVVVTFKDTYTFNTVLKDKPKTAQFIVRHPDQSKSYICNAPIEYIESTKQDKN